MNVVVVDAPRLGLQHRLARAADGLGRLSAGDRPLDEDRLHDVAHEEPLHARLGILDERLHEEPLARDVEAQPARALFVAGDTVGSDVHEAGALDRGALERRDVKREIDVDARPVRQVRRERAAPRACRGVAHAQGRPRALALDLGCGARDGADEARGRPVTVVAAQPAKAGRVAGELGGIDEHAVVRRADRAVPPGRERRGSARAADHRAEHRQEERPRELGKRAHLSPVRGRCPSMRCAIRSSRPPWASGTTR